MRYRLLGTTGLEISEITLGTVELGMDYGFQGTSHYRKPEERDSIALIHQALDEGINLIDTAPVYGSSEELIGKALRERSHRPYIATKVTIPPQNDPTQDVLASLSQSIDTSLKALHVETIDLLQIHNTTSEVLGQEEIVDFLERARHQGKMRFIGASTYYQGVSLQAIEEDWIDCLQVPFNILNQSMVWQVIPGAARRGKGILARSAFLRGLLTSQMEQAPELMAPLKRMAIAALQELNGEVDSLSEGALRFCLSFPGICSVLIGVRSREELESNLAAAERGVLPADCLANLRSYSMEAEPLTNTANWKEVM